MNRGSPATAGSARPPDRAFNEAPIHESGKFAVQLHTGGIMTTFNEAPIHESGKSFRPSRQPWIVCAFNEAPIHESGKSCSAPDTAPTA